MKFQLIEYRTPELPISMWAVIPDFYISDFLGWLKLSEHVFVSVTRNYRTLAPVTELLSDLVAPRDWPSYQTCTSFVRDTVILGER